jgi:hypothetical protein
MAHDFGVVGDAVTKSQSSDGQKEFLIRGVGVSGKAKHTDG